MIQVTFNPQELTGRHAQQWTRWLQQANAAIAENISIWEKWKLNYEAWKQTCKPGDPPPPPPAFNFKQGQRIWTKLKKILLKSVFNNKCAYCETSTVRYDGDAEHFRPKGAVMTAEGERVMTEDEGGRQIQHPGYFWLAYHWKNLLPACKGCNSGRGKQNKFPASEHLLLVRLKPEEVKTLKESPLPSDAWPGLFYLSPEDLDSREQPQLLHPYLGNPREHLGFREKGIVYAKSDKGKASIEALNLTEDLLRSRRQAAQERAYTLYQTAMNYFLLVKEKSEPESAETAWDDMQRYLEGREEYSAAAIDRISDYSVKFGASRR